MRPDELFIGGRWSEPSTGQHIEVVSPHTEEPVAHVAAAAPQDVDNAVAAARAAFDAGPWPRLEPAERIAAVRRLAALYGGRRYEMAELITSEIGDPTDAATQVGPLVARRQQERVRGYIEAGQAEGARLVTGGTGMPDGLDKGWYVRPTLFAEATNSMRIAREEIFGPVLTVIPYRDEDEAVAIANDSDYGLAGSVFTEDTDRGLRVAARIRTGTFGVNQGYTMDPFAPFGGVKGSGYGRELGREGIDGYTDTKSISVAASQGPAATTPGQEA